jgi:uncharacterized membrane protein
VGDDDAVSAPPGRVVDDDSMVEPTRADAFAAGMSRLIGGPLGKRAFRDGRGWIALPVVLSLVTIATCFLGWAQKLPCRDPGHWTHEYQYTRLCYSDVVALYYNEGLVGNRDAASGTGSRLEVPYRDHAVEYPVVIGGLMWVAAEATNVLHPHDPHVTTNAQGQSVVVDQRPETFFDVTAVLLAIAAIGVVITTAYLAGRRRPWDAMLVAVAPVLIFHADTNWDLVAVAFAGLGMLAWSRRHPLWAGVFLGLGIATKLYPLLLLVPLLALCVRARRMAAWTVTAAATVVTAVLANVPALLFGRAFEDGPNGSQVAVAPSVWSVLRHGGGWTAVRHSLAGIPLIGLNIPGHDSAKAAVWRFYTLNKNRSPDFDTWWYAIYDHTKGHRLATADGHVSCSGSFFVRQACSITTDTTRLNIAVGVVTLLVLGAVIVLGVAAVRRPRFAQLAFLTVAGFTLVNKVDSPQYVLWLVPLAVLARPRWGMFLVWQATEVLLLVARFPFFVGQDKPGQGIDYGWFFAAVVVRDLALLALMALVVIEVLNPQHDVVRRDGVDDPAGGVVDGAPDRWAPAPVGAPSSTVLPGSPYAPPAPT